VSLEIVESLVGVLDSGSAVLGSALESHRLLGWAPESFDVLVDMGNVDILLAGVIVVVIIQLNDWVVRVDRPLILAGTLALGAHCTRRPAHWSQKFVHFSLSPTATVEKSS